MEKAVKVDRWKRKVFYSILAPKLFNFKELGKTMAIKESQLVGRTATVSLAKLTGNREERYISVVFKINEVKGNKCYSDIVGQYIRQTYLGKFIRRGTAKILSVTDNETADKKKVRINCVALCFKTTVRKEREVRKGINSIVSEAINNSSVEELFGKIINGELAKKIVKRIANIVPVKRVEIIKAVVK